MKKTIYEGESGILWRNGAIVRSLGTGKHRYSLWRNEKITTVNIQQQEYMCPVQEYSSKDNLTVRFAIRLNTRISNVIALRRALPEGTQEQFICNAAIDSARSFLLDVTLDELLARKSEFQGFVAKEAARKLKGIGVDLVDVSQISILIPRSLRQAFEAEMSIKKKALADLEEARGRTAVLRHLANAATMVENQPVLLQLLMGQKARQVQFQFVSDKTAKQERQEKPPRK